MAKAGYSVATGASVSLASGVAKTALDVLAPASFGLDLQKVRFSFDGVTASAVPVLVELITISALGTNTSATPVQIYGRTIAHGCTAGYNVTAGTETAVAVVESYLITPNGGSVLYDWPLGTSPDTAVSNGFGLRFTAPASVGVRATMIFERC